MDQPLKILFIVPYVPNLIRVRPYNLIRHLSARGNQVSLITLVSSPEDIKDLNKMKEFCKEVKAYPLPRWRSMFNCMAALPRHVPLQAVYCWQPDMAAFLRQAVANSEDNNWHFDVIHVEHLRGAEYGLQMKETGRETKVNGLKAVSGQPPVFWDSVDCISLLFSQAAQQSKSPVNRLLTRFELERTRWYEGRVISQFDGVLVTSSMDKKAFHDLIPAGKKSSPITVLPNGVDLDYYRPAESSARQPDTLIITGKMSYHANVTMVLNFTEKVLPLIWQKCPKVKLIVVGKDPTKKIRDLERDPRITVTGTVPDIRPYFHQATMAVTPITYGVGIQNKVLEAMACGVPVVSSPKAISGISVVPGQEVLVGSTPEELAQAVLTLLDNPPLQEKLIGASLNYVRNHHQWPALAAELEYYYRSCTPMN